MVFFAKDGTAKCYEFQFVFKCLFADPDGNVLCPSNKLPVEVALAILSLWYVFYVF